MCDKTAYHEEIAMGLEAVKRQGEKFRAELEKGEGGRYPELAAMIKSVKRA